MAMCEDHGDRSVACVCACFCVYLFVVVKRIGM